MVVVPPARIVAPEFLTATGTLFRAMFSRASWPAPVGLVLCDQTCNELSNVWKSRLEQAQTYHVNKDWAIGDCAVDNDNGANLERAARSSIDHREGRAAVADGETRVQPAPVPDLGNTDDSIGDLDVTHGELLVSDVHAVETTRDDKIGHVTTRT